MMRSCLTRDGYEVVVVGDAAGVRARVGTGLPADLAVLDADLPDGNGLDLCRELRATAGWEEVPVLIVTGLSDEESVANAYMAGATDYVTSPPAWEVFRHRVSRLIQAGRERGRLEECEARVSGLMALIEEAVLAYDADARIELFAPSAVRMFGLPAAAAWGRPVGELFLDPLPLAADELAYRTVRARRGDGAEFMADVSVRRASDRGQPITLLVVRDVTERVTAERERQALEERLRQTRQEEALTALCGGVAHELNGVLTAALGYSEAARERVARDPAAANDLRQAEAAVGRARVLVDQLLAYAGRARTWLRPADLGTLLTDLPRAVAEHHGRAVPLAVHSQPGPLPVQVDADQLAHALVQLIVNAAEAADPPDPVTIRIGTEDLSPQRMSDAQVGSDVPAGEYAFVEVADTGPGIDAGTLVRIFEPFFTTKPRGRGLGLSVVAGVVKAHGGALRARSEPGRGTTVRIWLPLASSSPTPPRAPTRFKPDTCILVVDDEDLVRGVIKAMLERRGCEVLTASNGREGVDLFRREAGRVNAVLLDLNMPILDGERAVDEIRSTDPNVPIWIMTGYDPAGREERLALGHVRGVLRKPVTSETLVQALTAVLGT